MHRTIWTTSTKSIEHRMQEVGKDYARKGCSGYYDLREVSGEGKDLGNEFECKFE